RGRQSEILREDGAPEVRLDDHDPAVRQVLRDRRGEAEAQSGLPLAFDSAAHGKAGALAGLEAGVERAEELLRAADRPGPLGGLARTLAQLGDAADRLHEIFRSPESRASALPATNPTARRVRWSPCAAICAGLSRGITPRITVSGARSASDRTEWSESAK